MSNEQQPDENKATEQTETDQARDQVDRVDQAEQTQSEETTDTLQNADDASLRIAELEVALQEAQSKLAEQKDSVARAIASADNARKRAEGEVDKARKFALEKFAGELLPVVDNLERALQVSDPENETIKPILEGVELTHKSFIGTLEKFGLKAIDPQGEPFNPEQHQAMSMQPNEELAPNTVMAVMQKGYELNGRLLRPAMVMVSRAPDGAADSQGVDTQA
jgi:molecular chaperone GrpE